MVWHSLILFVLVHTSLSQFLPGTVPSMPSPTLDGCQNDANAANITSNYTSPYARVIHTWCSIYDEVLPCLDSSLPYTRLTDVEDWYLSMMFDPEIAYNKSDDMCSSYEEFADEMMCIEKYRDVSMDCIKFQTTHLATIILQLYQANATDNPHADTNACLYANYTATCMIRNMKTCSPQVVDLIHQYFTLLNGKCDQVLYENQVEHKNKTIPATQKRQQMANKFKQLIKRRKEAKLLKEKMLRQTVKQLITTVDLMASSKKVSSNETLIESVNGTDTTVADEILTGNQTVVVKKKKNKRKKKQEIKKLLTYVLDNL